MAAFDYTALAKTAADMLLGAGTTDTELTRATAAYADPSKPWNGDAEQDESIAKGFAVVMDHEMTTRGDPHQMLTFTALTPGVTARCYVPATVPESRPGDVLRVGARRFSVLTCWPVRPGDVTVLYELHLKG